MILQIDGTHLGIFPNSCADMIGFNSFAFPAQGYGGKGGGMGTNFGERRDYVVVLG